MSKVSEAIKAKRKQHRQDHGTAADRIVNQNNRGDVQGRKDARKKNFSAQGNKGASDFNFDQHGKGHISQQEINHLRDSGQSRDQIMAAVNAHGGELGKNVQSRFDRWGAAKEKAQAVKDNPVAPTPTPTPTPVTNNNGSNNDVDGTGNAVGVGNTDTTGNTGDVTDSPGAAVGIGNVAAGGNDVTGDGNATGIGNATNKQQVDNAIDFNQVQDNDQEIVNNGNNNFNYQRTDNSNRVYGASTNVFNYQGGSGENSLYDSPVSAATMGGFYDVDDSPAAQAKFLGLHTDLNADAQKRFAGDAMSIVNKYKTMGQGTPVDYEAENQKRLQASKDAAAIANNNIFGDQALWRGNLGEYKFGASPKPIDDPFEKDKDDDDD